MKTTRYSTSSNASYNPPAGYLRPSMPPSPHSRAPQRHANHNDTDPAGTDGNTAGPENVRAADILIQAGHEGRTSGATGAASPWGREIEWTPIVANEATRILRAAGISVIREDAFLEGTYNVKVAVFIHFDGSEDGSSGASVGYDDPTDRDGATAWKNLYRRHWPFRFMPDNFTENLRGYYGYRYTQTSDAEFVIECGDLDSREQARWLRPRLRWLGALLAHFLATRIGRNDIPEPGPFQESIHEAMPEYTLAAESLTELPAIGVPEVSPEENLALTVPFLKDDTRSVPELAVDPAVLEVHIRESELLPAWFLRVGEERARAVCKISTSGVNFLGGRGSWSGSGFLVAPNILLTNHHVLNSEAVARAGSAIFNFQDSPDGRPEPTTSFRLAPQRLFITNDELDFTFVWVDGDPGDRFGFIQPERSARPVPDGAFANIIQHPAGRPKEVSIQENKIRNQTLAAIRYTTDTEPGSSGSPVFDNRWSLFGLHHASRPADDGSTENEGIKLSAIAAWLEAIPESDPRHEAARTALSVFRGTDELMGYFGALGRTGAEQSHGVERVVNAYRGEIDDIDVGFWNVEWMVNRYQDKLDEVAKVIVALNLDIWALVETGDVATQALVDHLRDRYHLDFGVAFSEPGAGLSKQATAVLWNKETIQGEKRDWPADIEPWFHVHSRDFDELGLEAVEGKVFDRYPALYYFRTINRAAANREELDFHLVPLHLKAMDEGSKRRRMASKILGVAIREMINKHGADGDWVIGGDYNAELASGDFQPLADDGLVALSARDENGGAFSYLKSPKSLIDHIFVSPNLARRTGPDDYFIVAAERQFPDYVQKISDHRPALLRLSLGAGEAREVRRVEVGGLSEKLAAFGRNGGNGSNGGNGLKSHSSHAAASPVGN